MADKERHELRIMKTKAETLQGQEVLRLIDFRDHLEIQTHVDITFHNCFHIKTEIVWSVMENWPIMLQEEHSRIWVFTLIMLILNKIELKHFCARDILEIK